MAMTVIATLSGLVTLMPFGGDKECLAGYKAVCPFAPVSSTVCFLVAGFFYVLMIKRYTEKE